MAEKEELLLEGRKRKRSPVPSTETPDMYLILPNFADIHKAEINEILDTE